MNSLRLATAAFLILVSGMAIAQDKSTENAPTNSQDPASASSHPSDGSASRESIAQWQFRQPVEVVPADTASLYEIIISPEVFDQARTDLSDLRLYDAGGREIPYGLQTRMPQQDRQLIFAKEFNRATGDGDSHELSLDLGEEPTEHNEIEVITKGTEYRRRVVVEGSNDAQDWKMLKDDVLLQMTIDGKEIRLVRIQYPTSRYRYLRLRVYPDPLLGNDSPEILVANSQHNVEVPGEFVWRVAKFGDRTPIRADGNPGSAWMIELGGNNTPCDQIEVQFASTEFHRDYYLEREEMGYGLTPSMFPFHNATFERKLGERKPLVAEFSEMMASRIRLVVVDYRNSPLKIQSVRFRGAVRAVVFAVDPAIQKPVQLYYGNISAETPGYDFARNLPAKLVSKPLELKLGAREANPAYVPPPKPLTERWPWLVYVVLTVAIVGLAGLILSVARTAIATADAQPENAVS